MIGSEAPQRPGPRLLVVGCGGIGGVVAAHLIEQGHDVTALTTNTLILDAINANGFRLRGEGSPGTVRGRAVRELKSGTAPFDVILLATQPPQVEDAARQTLPMLAPSGAMVCLQNGLCEERVSAIAGVERVIGAIVSWGATMIEPGMYDRTSAGGFVVGRLDGAPDSRVDELAMILECIGPTTVTKNLAGARWSKLAINCAISSLGTIGGDRLGALMRHRFVRRMTLELMTETVLAARALGIRLEKVAGTVDLDWIALTDADRQATGSPSLFAKHALLLAVGARYRRLRSSMLAAIERGRAPAIEFLNGEVVSRGARLGIATPMNIAARDEVLRIARGQARPDLELLRRLYERTRGAPATAPILSVPSSGVDPTGKTLLASAPPAASPGPAGAPPPAWRPTEPAAGDAPATSDPLAQPGKSEPGPPAG